MKEIERIQLKYIKWTKLNKNTPWYTIMKDTEWKKIMQETVKRAMRLRKNVQGRRRILGESLLGTNKRKGRRIMEKRKERRMVMVKNKYLKEWNNFLQRGEETIKELLERLKREGKEEIRTNFEKSKYIGEL